MGEVDEVGLQPKELESLHFASAASNFKTINVSRSSLAAYLEEAWVGATVPPLTPKLLVRWFHEHFGHTSTT
jgi:hypothetical protein